MSWRVPLAGGRQRRALLSVPCGWPRGRGGPRGAARRVLSGIILVLRAGWRGRATPAGSGPPKTLFNRFGRWIRAGVLARLCAPHPGRCCSPRPLCRHPARCPLGSQMGALAPDRPPTGRTPCQVACGLRRRWPPPDPAAPRRPGPRLSWRRGPVGRPAPVRRPGILTAPASAAFWPGAASPPASPVASTAGTRSTPTPPSPNGAPASRARAADSRRGTASPGKTADAPTPASAPSASPLPLASGYGS